MRVDFNVPYGPKDQNPRKIIDDTRIQAALASIKYLLEKKAKLILMSHLGRPKGERRPELSLAPVAKRLEKLLKRKVLFSSDCIGAEVEEKKAELEEGQVLLLENLRFHPAEEKPEMDKSFAEKLASLADIYVNDAFGSAHRAHSSVTEITKYFPERSACGFLLEKEIDFLGKAILKAERPFYAIIGGAKISSKIGVIKSLSQKVDGLIIGGGMAYTFLKALGKEIGDSIFEESQLALAREIIDRFKKEGRKLVLPCDFVTANDFSEDADIQITSAEEGIEKGYQGLDIGPKSCELFAKELSSAACVIWNGPLGVYEIKAFSKGTEKIAQVLSELKATTIIGGGDCVAAVKACKLAEKMSHISTGGGAALEFIEFTTLPGLESLSNKKSNSL